MFNNLTTIFVLTFICILDISPVCAQEGGTEYEKDHVYVMLAQGGEEESIQLSYGQKAEVEVHLASLGDPLDKYMVELFNRETSEREGSALSDIHGIVTFRELTPGKYAVYVNQRVLNGEFNTVKAADVILSISK